MKNQKGFLQLVVVLVVAAALVVVGYSLFARNKTTTTTSTPQVTVPPQLQTDYNEGRQEAPVVNSKAGLDAASKSLDSTNTTQIDTELNALSSDSSGF